ncbi:MAG: hypothetical protein AB7S44_03925 [Spirochaetales bacterium]
MEADKNLQPNKNNLSPQQNNATNNAPTGQGPVRVPKMDQLVSSGRGGNSKLEKELKKQAQKRAKQREKEDKRKRDEEKPLIEEQPTSNDEIIRGNTDSSKFRSTKTKTTTTQKPTAQRPSTVARDEKRLIREQERLERASRPQIKDIELDDLSGIEQKVLYQTHKKSKKVLIILLIVSLISSVVTGGYIIIKNAIDNRAKPVEVDIVVRSENVETMELSNPDDPDSPLVYKLFYPGDTFGIELFVTNAPNLRDFPVFFRFRAYVEVDSQFEPFIFIPTFADPEDWYMIVDDNGYIMGDSWAYYAGYLNSNETVQVLTALTFSSTLVTNYYQGKHFVLYLEIEAIEGDVQAIQDFEDWFLLAPQDWIEYINTLEPPTSN